MKKYLIISPCYNAGDYLISHLEELKKLQDHADILIINDGSTDRSFEIIENSGLHYLNSHKNHGKASALQQGFYFAIRNKYEAILSIDSDLQHDHNSIPEFIKEFEKKEFDYLIGAREFKHKKMPVARIFSNKLTSTLLSFLVNQKLLDSQCGLRMISRAYLDLKVNSDGFQYESEHLIRSIWAGAKVKFIKTKTIYNASQSSMNHILDTLLFIKMYIQLMNDKFNMEKREL